jgi:5'-methylthioadenosine phosphorylase
MPEIALVAGSGLEKSFKIERNLKIGTPYGVAEAARLEIFHVPVLFLPRHGQGHSLPPHTINYRANLFALKKAGVKKVVATSAVGSLRTKIRPGDFVIPHQLLDFTKARPSTFFDGADGRVVHTDVTETYSKEVREALIGSFSGQGHSLHTKAVYVCTEGPRYETPAEITMFRRLGGDVVGMTGYPEAVLAKELGLKYATVCIVTNYGAGMQKRVDHAEVLKLMERAMEDVRHGVKEAIRRLATPARFP